MIDTIRFKVQLNDQQSLNIHRKLTKVEVYDNFLKHLIFKIHKATPNLGSFDRKINIFVNQENECFIELSLPKFMMGHNIYLIYCDDLPIILAKLHKKIADFFGDFPPTVFWEIERLDICYSWKFRNHQVAVKVMDLLQRLEIPRKTKSSYASSVMYKGSDFTIKFYLKDDEFFAHDFKELKRLGHTDLAYQLYDIAQGVLRYEITLRKNQINRAFFGKNKGTIYYQSDVFTNDRVSAILNVYLMKLLQSQTEVVTLDTVCNRLVDLYGTTKGMHLYFFYKEYYGEENSRSKLCRNFSRQSVWRMLKKLKDANVGLVLDTVPTDFDLSIPSSNVVNMPVANPPEAGATSRV